MTNIIYTRRGSQTVWQKIILNLFIPLIKDAETTIVLSNGNIVMRPSLGGRIKCCTPTVCLSVRPIYSLPETESRMETSNYWESKFEGQKSR